MAVMFLRATIRRKDGKEHRYWSLFESKRVTSMFDNPLRRKGFGWPQGGEEAFEATIPA